MKRYYANLLGTWTDITTAGTVENRDTQTYFEENLTYQDGAHTPECYKYGYVNVQYNGKNYRSDPACIQIVEE